MLREIRNVDCVRCTQALGVPLSDPSGKLGDARHVRSAGNRRRGDQVALPAGDATPHVGCHRSCVRNPLVKQARNYGLAVARIIQTEAIAQPECLRMITNKPKAELREGGNRERWKLAAKRIADARANCVSGALVYRERRDCRGIRSVLANEPRNFRNKKGCLTAARPGQYEKRTPYIMHRRLLLGAQIKQCDALL